MEVHSAATKKKGICLILVGALISLPSFTRADLVYFQPSGSAMLPVDRQGDKVVLHIPNSTLELPYGELRKWVPGFCPEREITLRKKAIKVTDFDSRESLVWWAIENGLTLEVMAEIREIDQAAPGRERIRRMAAIAEKLVRPGTDPDDARFQRALGTEMRVSRGTHVLLLHQHSESEAAERIALLERVIAGFYLTMAAEGFALKIPGDRLVSAWFANQSDYLEFLKQNEAGAFLTTRGYFHPTWNAVVAFDDRSHELQVEGRRAIESNRQSLKTARESVERLSKNARLKLKISGQPAISLSRANAGATLDRLERGLDVQTLLLDLDRRAIDDGTAAHEMIHQLVMSSGLAPWHDAFPQWLHEGFASQFEVIRGGRWAGISRAHDLRMPDWRKMSSPPGLERLVRDGGFGHGYQRDLYAQSWALVYFLRTQHSGQFVTFLDLLRGSSVMRSELEQADRSASDRVIDCFGRAFGQDLAKLEKEWHAYMASVQTPLESDAPGSAPRNKPVMPSATTARSQK